MRSNNWSAALLALAATTFMAAPALAFPIPSPEMLCEMTGGTWDPCLAPGDILSCDDAGENSLIAVPCVPGCKCPKEAPYFEEYYGGCISEDQCHRAGETGETGTDPDPLPVHECKDETGYCEVEWGSGYCECADGSGGGWASGNAGPIQPPPVDDLETQCWEALADYCGDVSAESGEEVEPGEESGEPPGSEEPGAEETGREAEAPLSQRD